MMPSHKDCQFRKPFLQQKRFSKSAHITGEKYITVFPFEQDRKATFIDRSPENRRIDRKRCIRPADLQVMPDKHLVPITGFYDPFPELIRVFRIRQEHLICRHSGQQIGKSSGMIPMIMGQYHAIQPLILQ